MGICPCVDLYGLSIYTVPTVLTQDRYLCVCICTRVYTRSVRMHVRPPTGGGGCPPPCVYYY